MAAITVVLLGLSIWLRTRQLHGRFWIDEALSVGIAEHPLSHIPALMRQDGSPPLYYLLLHVWLATFGRGEATTHVLSLLFALACIPVALLAGRSLFGLRAGVVCAVLAAANTYLNIYAQETRMYSLLALLGLLTAAAFINAFVLRRRRYLPVFILSLTAALYTHNWAIFYALMLAAAFLRVVQRSPDRSGLWRDGGIALGSVFVLYLPWLPTLIYQAQHTGAPWNLSPALWSITQGAYSLVGGRGAAMALLFGALIGLVPRVAARRNGARSQLTIESLLIVSLGTLLLAWAYSKTTPAWSPRYLGVVVGPLILLFGLGISRAGRLGILALGLTLGFWLLDPVPGPVQDKSNVAEATASLRGELHQVRLVLSTQPEQVPAVAYYLPVRPHYLTPLGVVHDPGVVDWRNALDRFEQSRTRTTLIPQLRTLRSGDRVLLVTPLRVAKRPRWMQLINHSNQTWLRTLRSDPSLRLLASSSTDSRRAAVPVKLWLFAVRSLPHRTVRIDRGSPLDPGSRT